MSKPKPKATKAKTAVSQFQGIDNATVSLGGLVNSSATRQPGQSIDVTSTLSQPLQTIQNQATSGIANNQAFLNRNPVEQLQDVEAGRNSFFNLQDELNRRAAQEAMAQAQSRYSANGLENSTVRGAMEGRLINDQILTDLATRSNAIQTQNQLAQSNLGVNNEILGQLAALQQFPTQMVNKNLMQGLQNQDQVSMFNAQQQNDIAKANLQAQISAANQPSIWGTALSALGSIGGSLVGGPLGGSIGGALGKLGGGIFGGGGGNGGGMVTNPLGGLTSGAFSSLANSGAPQNMFYDKSPFLMRGVGM